MTQTRVREDRHWEWEKNPTLSVRFTKVQLGIIESLRANLGHKSKADTVRHLLDLGAAKYQGVSRGES